MASVIKLLSALGKYGSRKWLAAIVGNVLLALFTRWLLPALAAIAPALAWLGLGVIAALAIGLWVYVIVEGRLDLEKLRHADPAAKAKALLAVYVDAVQQGVKPEHALEIIWACMDQDATEFVRALDKDV